MAVKLEHLDRIGGLALVHEAGMVVLVDVELGDELEPDRRCKEEVSERGLEDGRKGSDDTNSL